MVGVVAEFAPRRRKIGLAHRGDHPFLVGEIALHCAHRRIDQQDAVVALRAVENRHLAVFPAVVRDVFLVRRILQVRAPVAGLVLAERRVLHRRDRDLVHRIHGVQRKLPAKPRFRVLPQERDAHAAGIEDEHRLRIFGTQLGELRLVVGLPEPRIDLVDDAPLVGALEPVHHVLAGGVVRRHDVHVGDALVLHHLAHRLGRVVVLPGSGEEQLVALLSGELVRACVRADHELARVRDRGRDREHHVRPDDSRHEVDLVFFQHLVRDLLAHVGLDLVVAVDHFDVEPRHLAPQVIERELHRVPHVLTDHSLGSRQRRDETDLHLLLRERGA